MSNEKLDYSQHLSANILVIGKTGVGKSSLLNYIFGKEIEETGCGEPVTQKGIYPHPFTYDRNFTINIYDTWGLESDKADEWKKMLKDSINEHDKKEVHEWFNTIIFCTSLDANRFEDFEVKMIKELLDAKNNVIVAITHCSEPNDQEALRLRDDLICPSTGLTKDDVILMSSVKQELISGECTKQFGRERILTLMIRNLWRAFKEKLPYMVQSRIELAMNEGRECCHRIVDKTITPLLFIRQKQLDKLQEDMNVIINKTIKEITHLINDNYKNAYEYYDALSKKYTDGIYLDEDKLKANDTLKFDSRKSFNEKAKQDVEKLYKLFKVKRSDKNEEFKNKITSLIQMLRTDLSTTKQVKIDLHLEVDKFMAELEAEIEKHHGAIKKYINSLDISEKYIRVDRRRNK